MNIGPVTTGFSPIQSDLSKDWQLWEYKTLNMHRGLIDFRPSNRSNPQEIEKAIRETVVSSFSPTWARGFAFGVVVQFATSPEFQLSEFIECVDSFNRNDGVLQWVIAIDHQNQRAFAAHMWMHGSLHSSFIDSLTQLERAYYSIDKGYKEQPAFFARINKLVVSAGRLVGRLRTLQSVLAGGLLLYVVWRYVRTSF
ncbi:MAG: hypothetical protein HZC22_03125 [Rhodocyclales bacterium]|nr:hypothetical protein [Rhodocyclales bacterium]